MNYISLNNRWRLLASISDIQTKFQLNVNNVKIASEIKLIR